MLAVDQTGVGRPVVDMLRRSSIQADIRPITITAGHAVSPGDGGGWHVPKKELVNVLQVMLQSRRIKVAPTLPEAETLVREFDDVPGEDHGCRQRDVRGLAGGAA